MGLRDGAPTLEHKVWVLFLRFVGYRISKEFGSRFGEDKRELSIIERSSASI